MMNCARHWHIVRRSSVKHFTQALNLEPRANGFFSSLGALPAALYQLPTNMKKSAPPGRTKERAEAH
jgi:hypothetical protein